MTPAEALVAPSWTRSQINAGGSHEPTHDVRACAKRHIASSSECESRVNLTLETEVSTKRAPSVVVYTLSGYVGVHFPGLNRKPFTSDPPIDAEAKKALRGYVGYFGALRVYPGQVFNQILGGTVSAGTTLKHFFDLAPGGDMVNLRFPVARNAQGQETTALVTMKRLSGVSDFLVDPPTR